MDFLKHFLFIYMIRDTICFCGSDPSGIKVTTKSAKSINVTWDTTKINCGYTITGYSVYFNSLYPLKTYKHKYVRGATTDNIEIFPIVPGFSYNIFVKALSATGEVSNPTYINYTHPHSKPTAAPGNIHASSKGFTTLTVSWDALNIFVKTGDIKGYKVYYRGPGLTGTNSANVLGESNCHYDVNGLQPNSTYQFILQAINDVGPGQYSGFINISTLTLPTTTTLVPTTLPTPIPTTKTIMTTIPTTTKTATTPIKTTTVSTSTIESTIQRTTRFKSPKNPSSHIMIRTTLLPRDKHTAVTPLRHGKLKSGQIAGIVICCVLTVFVVVVWYILWFSERTIKWIEIRRIQPIKRQP